MFYILYIVNLQKKFQYTLLFNIPFYIHLSKTYIQYCYNCHTFFIFIHHIYMFELNIFYIFFDLIKYYHCNLYYNILDYINCIFYIQYSNYICILFEYTSLFHKFYTMNKFYRHVFEYQYMNLINISYQYNLYILYIWKYLNHLYSNQHDNNIFYHLNNVFLCIRYFDIGYFHIFCILYIQTDLFYKYNNQKHIYYHMHYHNYYFRSDQIHPSKQHLIRTNFTENIIPRLDKLENFRSTRTFHLFLHNYHF